MPQDHEYVECGLTMVVYIYLYINVLFMIFSNNHFLSWMCIVLVIPINLILLFEVQYILYIFTVLVGVPSIHWWDMQGALGICCSSVEYWP